jgi:site-specific recombinase XerD
MFAPQKVVPKSERGSKLRTKLAATRGVRHSSATWARAGGARLDAIAGMLGHASVTTTGIYARIVDKIAENPARYLEGLMGLS